MAGILYRHLVKFEPILKQHTSIPRSEVTNFVIQGIVTMERTQQKQIRSYMPVIFRNIDTDAEFPKGDALNPNLTLTLP